MGISRDSRHKRSATGAKRAQYRKKRKFESGRQAAGTKIGGKRIHTVRVRGGNVKFRALRLDSGNFSWSSETFAKKTRIIRVVYNSTNNELVRTNTLVKGCIVEIDAAPFRQWYENHYAVALGRRHKKEAQASISSYSSRMPTRPMMPSPRVDPTMRHERLILERNSLPSNRPCLTSLRLDVSLPVFHPDQVSLDVQMVLF